MTRGDIIVVAARGAYADKPRPALVVQSDEFNETHASVTVCLITTDCIDASIFRIAIPPGTRTGLTAASQIMADRVVSVPRLAIAKSVGHCDAAELHAVDDALRRWMTL